MSQRPIVIQLQEDAVAGETSATSLLRKALVVAKKLGLGEFEEWIDRELNAT
jgi:hypothetical protein